MLIGKSSLSDFSFVDLAHQFFEGLPLVTSDGTAPLAQTACLSLPIERESSCRYYKDFASKPRNMSTDVEGKMQFTSQLTQTLTFGFTKLAVLLFYNRWLLGFASAAERIYLTFYIRIFGQGKIFSILLWTMAIITTIWTVAFFFANLFQCMPISINWTGLGGTVENCIVTDQMYLAQAWSDVFTDGKRSSLHADKLASNDLQVAILSLPIPSVR